MILTYSLIQENMYILVLILITLIVGIRLGFFIMSLRLRKQNKSLRQIDKQKEDYLKYYLHLADDYSDLDVVYNLLRQIQLIRKGDTK